jgi:hypothetical protein
MTADREGIDPRSRKSNAKSVMFTKDGLRESQRVLNKLFVRAGNPESM